MIKNYYQEIERTVGSLKFAVTILIIFTLLMIIGTFVESFCGADFANRILYKKPLFIIVQISMFFSIYFATTLRLPFKKRLTGFYLTHLGLMIIGFGALETYLNGIDGQIYLPPKETNRMVDLSRDEFTIENMVSKEVVRFPLPYRAFESELNIPFKNILIQNYIPFAKDKVEWQQPLNNYNYQSTSYYFKNAFAEQDLTFTLNPEAIDEFPNVIDLGPLKFIYLGEQSQNCFLGHLKNENFLVNITTNECLKKNNQLPTSNNDNLLEISTNRLKEKPTVILFGKSILFWNKNSNKWEDREFQKEKAIVLPWMNAELSIMNYQNNLIPKKIPYFSFPKQKKGQLIEGSLKGVSLSIMGKTYWVTNENSLGLRIQGIPYLFKLQNEKIQLPFEMTLTDFKMDKDPGTNTPASYESFVEIFNGKIKEKAHIYMNHPFKLDGFTLYQASYNENNDGTYSTTLAVNVDQGRSLKYLGSLLLVIGAILHFYLKSKKGSI